jgi:hypothetical protein
MGAQVPCVNKLSTYMIYGKDNCTIGPCGWPKLQITSCGINMNSDIHLVDLTYKSIPRVKFR